jgi:hypothetical protein
MELESENEKPSLPAYIQGPLSPLAADLQQEYQNFPDSQQKNQPGVIVLARKERRRGLAGPNIEPQPRPQPLVPGRRVSVNPEPPALSRSITPDFQPRTEGIGKRNSLESQPSVEDRVIQVNQGPRNAEGNFRHGSDINAERNRQREISLQNQRREQLLINEARNPLMGLLGNLWDRVTTKGILYFVAFSLLMAGFVLLSLPNYGFKTPTAVVVFLFGVFFGCTIFLGNRLQVWDDLSYNPNN